MLVVATPLRALLPQTNCADDGGVQDVARPVVGPAHRTLRGEIVVAEQ
jgi:hypothetical protein